MAPSGPRRTASAGAPPPPSKWPLPSGCLLPPPPRSLPAGGCGKGDADRGNTVPRTILPRHIHPHAVLLRAWSDDNRGHIADIDWTAIARGDEQEPDIGNAGERLPGRD